MSRIAPGRMKRVTQRSQPIEGRSFGRYTTSTPQERRNLLMAGVSVQSCCEICSVCCIDCGWTSIDQLQNLIWMQFHGSNCEMVSVEHIETLHEAMKAVGEGPRWVQYLLILIFTIIFVIVIITSVTNTT